MGDFKHRSYVEGSTEPIGPSFWNYLGPYSQTESQPLKPQPTIV